MVEQKLFRVQEAPEEVLRPDGAGRGLGDQAHRRLDLRLGGGPVERDEIEGPNERLVGQFRVAKHFHESAVGLSLMISPHPSYPPLEMAAFGLQTLTNQFAGKALARDHPNIVDLAELSPDTIAAELQRLAAAFEDHLRDPGRHAWSIAPGPFVRQEPLFPFANRLRDTWGLTAAELARLG